MVVGVINAKQGPVQLERVERVYIIAKIIR